jgi:hypothetical protein
MLTVAHHVRRFKLVSFAAAWGAAVAGSFLIFTSLIGGDGPHDAGQSELACAKAKLEALWGMRLPAKAAMVAPVPGSSVASADWDLKALGCSGRIHPLATLELR